MGRKLWPRTSLSGLGSQHRCERRRPLLLRRAACRERRGLSKHARVCRFAASSTAASPPPAAPPPASLARCPGVEAGASKLSALRRTTAACSALTPYCSDSSAMRFCLMASSSAIATEHDRLSEGVKKCGVQAGGRRRRAVVVVAGAPPPLRTSYFFAAVRCSTDELRAPPAYNQAAPHVAYY